MEFIFLINLATTLCLTGIIWFVQIVHYTLFDRVGAERFVAYAAAHGRLTTSVVAPLMLSEAATGLALLWRRPTLLSFEAALALLVLIVVVWLSTFLLQVPRHSSLARGFDQAAYDALRRTNWLRTCAWSARSLILLEAVHRMLAVD